MLVKIRRGRAVHWGSEWSSGRGKDQGHDQVHDQVQDQNGDQEQNQEQNQDQDRDQDQDWKPERLSETRKNFTLTLVDVDSPALPRVTKALDQDRDYQDY
ncbi:hypothetical protein BGZ79_005067 [Entomortierella chlamydospora]|nr:hypothetical protein BGZ79_005067 [Entomortierella chlamydospora]